MMKGQLEIYYYYKHKKKQRKTRKDEQSPYSQCSVNGKYFFSCTEGDEAKIKEAATHKIKPIYGFAS
jgi:hypothetical protein